MEIVTSVYFKFCSIMKGGNSMFETARETMYGSDQNVEIVKKRNYKIT